jgi:hypothetical protein
MSPRIHFALLVAATGLGPLTGSIAAAQDSSSFSVAGTANVAPAVTFTVENKDFNGAFSLSSPKDKEVTIKLPASLLRVDDGRTFPLTLNVIGRAGAADGSFKVEPAQSLQIAMSAELPEAAIYRGSVVVETIAPASARQVFGVQVERRAATLPEAVLEIPSPARIDLPLSQLWSASPTPVLANVRNTTLRPLKLARPDISDVVEKIGSASYAVTQHNARAKFICDTVKPTGEVDLALPQTCPLEVTLAVPGAGAFEAKVALTGVNGGSVSKAIALNARHSWVLALAFILSGAVVAGVIRSWRSGGRAVFARLEAAAGLDERLKTIRAAATLDDPRQVVDRLAVRIRSLISSLRGGTIKDDAADAALVALRNQVEAVDSWLVIEKGYVALSPDDKNFVRPQRDPILESLLATGDTFDATAMRDKLSAYSKMVRDAASVAGVRQQVESTARIINAYLETIKDKPDAAQLGPSIEEARQATGRLISGLTERNAAGLPENVKAAKASYVGVAAKLLRHRLPDAAPQHVDTALWPAHREQGSREIAEIETTRQLDPDRAEEALKSSLRRHMEFLVKALRDVIEAKKKDTPALLDNLVTVGNKLRDLASNLDPARFETAYARYHEAANDFDAVVQGNPVSPPPAQPGSRLEAGGSEPAPVPKAVIDFGPAPAFLPPTDATAQGYAQRAKIMECLTNIAAAGLAAVAGIQALWVSNLTWGSTNDIITALFWGAALGYGLGAGLDELLKPKPK